MAHLSNQRCQTGETPSQHPSSIEPTSEKIRRVVGRPFAPGQSGNPGGIYHDPAETAFRRELNRHMKRGRNMQKFVRAIVDRATSRSDRMAIEIIARLDGKLADTLNVNDQKVVILPSWMDPNATQAPTEDGTSPVVLDVPRETLPPAPEPDAPQPTKRRPGRPPKSERTISPPPDRPTSGDPIHSGYLLRRPDQSWRAKKAEAATDTPEGEDGTGSAPPRPPDVEGE